MPNKLARRPIFTMVFVVVKIFSKAETIFPVSETVVFGIRKIFSVIEAIFPVVETTVSAPESIFSEVEKILVASDNMFFATKSVFSVAKTGDADRLCTPAGSPKLNPPNVQNRSASPVFPSFCFPYRGIQSGGNGNC